MKVVIPAKEHSTRVASKNWRDFHKGKNLTEIKIEQVLNSVAASDIYLSSDNKGFEKKANDYGINFIHRHPVLASDDTPWPDAFTGIIRELPLSEEEDIAWVEVINPVFDQYEALFKRWQTVKTDHDSLVLVSKFSKFLMNAKGKPLNFMYGKWHNMSQDMEAQYIWDSACIMSKRDMLYFGYPIGRKPYLFSIESEAVDIDSMDDFKMAQYLYTSKFEHENT